MKRWLLLGEKPDLPWEFVSEPPYDGIVIGSLTFSELLYFRNEQVLQALATGMPVYLYTPGLPQCANRALSARLASAQRELKNWGVLFTDGGRKTLITAQEAKLMRQQGRSPAPGAVLTPLAKEILEGSH